MPNLPFKEGTSIYFQEHVTVFLDQEIQEQDAKPLYQWELSPRAQIFKKITVIENKAQEKNSLQKIK